MHSHTSRISCTISRRSCSHIAYAIILTARTPGSPAILFYFKYSPCCNLHVGLYLHWWMTVDSLNSQTHNDLVDGAVTSKDTLSGRSHATHTWATTGSRGRSPLLAPPSSSHKYLPQLDRRQDDHTAEQDDQRRDHVVAPVVVQSTGDHLVHQSVSFTAPYRLNGPSPKLSNKKTSVLLKYYSSIILFQYLIKNMWQTHIKLNSERIAVQAWCAAGV